MRKISKGLRQKCLVYSTVASERETHEMSIRSFQLLPKDIYSGDLQLYTRCDVDDPTRLPELMMPLYQHLGLGLFVVCHDS